MENKKVKVTIFTPTYNRADLLPRLYESLLSQTNKDFEWLIVDDGSTDNTKELINHFIAEENDFHIVYKQQINGGKHRAINTGVKNAQGELFFIVDSDDWLRADAIDVVITEIKGLDQSKFAGIAGQRVDKDGKLIGTTFTGNTCDAFMHERSKYHISGDKSEVFFIDIMKRFPFPEIDGEKFCPEALVWNRISEAGYKLRYINQGIYICDYQDSGLSSKIDQLLIDNFKSYTLYIQDTLGSSHYVISEKLHAIANFMRRAHINNISITSSAKLINVNKTIASLGYITAILVYKKRER